MKPIAPQIVKQFSKVSTSGEMAALFMKFRSKLFHIDRGNDIENIVITASNAVYGTIPLHIKIVMTKEQKVSPFGRFYNFHSKDFFISSATVYPSLDKRLEFVSTFTASTDAYPVLTSMLILER